MPQPRAYQILVRGDPQYAREQPQEMERADFRSRRGLLQIDLLVGLGVDPQRRFYRAAAIPRPGRHRCLRASGGHLDEAAGEHCADLVKPDIAAVAGAAPIRHASVRSPMASTTSGLRKKDRHSSPQIWSWVQVNLSPG